MEEMGFTDDSWFPERYGHHLVQRIPFGKLEYIHGVRYKYCWWSCSSRTLKGLDVRLNDNKKVQKNYLKLNYPELFV